MGEENHLSQAGGPAEHHHQAVHAQTEPPGGGETVLEGLDRIEVKDGDAADAAAYLNQMFTGMGDTTILDVGDVHITLQQQGLRIVRGLNGRERDLVLECWIQLWVGALQSQQIRKALRFEDLGDALHWQLSPVNPTPV